MPEEPPPSPDQLPPWVPELVQVVEIGNHFRFEHILHLSAVEQSNIQDAAVGLAQAIYGRNFEEISMALNCLRQSIIWPIQGRIDTKNHQETKGYTQVFVGLENIFKQFLARIQKIISSRDIFSPDGVLSYISGLGPEISSLLTMRVPQCARNQEGIGSSSSIKIGPRMQQVWYSHQNDGRSGWTQMKPHPEGALFSLLVSVNGSDVQTLTHTVKEAVMERYLVEPAGERWVAVAVFPEHIHGVRGHLEKVCQRFHGRVHETVGAD